LLPQAAAVAALIVTHTSRCESRMRLPSQRERWEVTEALPVHETPRTGWGARLCENPCFQAMRALQTIDFTGQYLQKNRLFTQTGAAPGTHRQWPARAPALAPTQAGHTRGRSPGSRPRSSWARGAFP
jgi:hypothetical protein